MTSDSTPPAPFLEQSGDLPSPEPVDCDRLGLEMSLTAASIRAVRKSLYRLIAQSHGVFGLPETAVIVLDGVRVAAALEALAGRLAPGPRAD
jgi:hypothetical protein